MKTPISQEWLRTILKYDPDSGDFFWLQNRGPAKKGDKAGFIWTGRDGRQYRTIKTGGKSYLAHRLAWLYVHGFIPEIIDHINCDGLDNRLQNLRISSSSQNSTNRRVSRINNTGLKGVTKESGRYSAHIWYDGKSHRLGRFDTPEEAHAAYCREARKRFGNFSRTG